MIGQSNSIQTAHNAADDRLKKALVEIDNTQRIKIYRSIINDFRMEELYAWLQCALLWCAAAVIINNTFINRGIESSTDSPANEKALSRTSANYY